MIITCRTCGKRYKMPAQPVDKLPVSVRCKGCHTVIPVRETVAQAISTQGDVRKVRCSDCGKEYRIRVRNLPEQVTTTTCKACGGKVKLGQPPSTPPQENRKTVSDLFSDPSLEETPDFDMSSLMANGSLTGSTGAETLPEAEPPTPVGAEEGDPVESAPVEIDFDKMTRLVKVLVIGALIIIIAGMTITRIRVHLEDRAHHRQEQQAAQEANIKRLQESHPKQTSESATESQKAPSGSEKTKPDDQSAKETPTKTN